MSWWWDTWIDKNNLWSLYDPIVIASEFLNATHNRSVSTQSSSSTIDLQVMGTLNIDSLKAVLWMHNKNFTWNNVLGHGVVNPIDGAIVKMTNAPSCATFADVDYRNAFNTSSVIASIENVQISSNVLILQPPTFTTMISALIKFNGC